jgi:lipopolysaccharide/colanic/teichoic acid biosynthesis glycosyltransferase
VKGEMALVGPRAEQPDMVTAFERAIPFYSYRHAIRPGLTGWAQVNYGYAATLDETIVKLSYDLYYVRHMSPVLDLTILWRSVWTVLTGRGAR